MSDWLYWFFLVFLFLVGSCCLIFLAAYVYNYLYLKSNPFYYYLYKLEDQIPDETNDPILINLRKYIKQLTGLFVNSNRKNRMNLIEVINSLSIQERIILKEVLNTIEKTGVKLTDPSILKVMEKLQIGLKRIYNDVMEIQMANLNDLLDTYEIDKDHHK